MAVPAGPRADAIYDWAGRFVQEWVRNHCDHNTATVLDVGAGWGKYRDLLPEFTMDACEIWPTNVTQEELVSRYRSVFIGDICDLVNEWSCDYTVVIFGDVLEHLTTERAQATLNKLYTCCDYVLVIVPFLYEQDEVDGNPYEKHEQADLTPVIMSQRYPELELLQIEYHDDEPFKGFYLGADDE